MISLSIALQAGGILLREGLEAMLVISALAGFLRRGGADGTPLKMLYAGAIAAVLFSIAGAVVMALFLNGAHDDRVEAAIMLLAAALMLYMSGWLFLKQDPQAWKAEMKAMAEKALASRTAEALALIAFLAVIREGAETVLFLHALAGTSGGWNISMIGGLVAAGALLAGLFVAMQWLALHLPLRPLFLATSALLFVMALRFIAGAVQEFQEQGLVAVHDAPLPDWIVNFGFNPNWESVTVPGVIAIVALASTLALRLRAKASPSPSAAE